jgi:hypothetical protein
MGIIHTGNWEWRAGLDGTATVDGDCALNPMTCTSWWYGTIGNPFDWGIGYDGFGHLSLSAHEGTLRFNWSATGLFLDGVFNDPQNLPVGFRVRDAYHLVIGTTGPPPSGNFHMNFQFEILGFDEDITDFGASPHIYDREFSGFGDNATINLLAFLDIGGWPFIASADSPAYPLGSGTHILLLAGTLPPKFYGLFDIIYWWWTLPQEDACGNNNAPRTDHLIFGGDQPPTPEGSSGEYEKLDPDDPDAAPSIVIEYVNPDHGRGGTAVEIHGSGFGDDANVQFDGADAGDIVVVSQYLITCVAPSHANGFANIVVINPDGGTS